MSSVFRKFLQVLVKDLEEYCDSESLSSDTLRKKIWFIPACAVENSSFLHRACSNKNITMGVIECLLDAYPNAASIWTYVYSPHRRSMTRACPLHLACHNEYCPISVIKLLLNKNPTALYHACLLGKGIHITEVGSSGLPLHYYLMRKSCIDLEVVEAMVTAYPGALTVANNEIHSTPIHILLQNHNVNNLFDVLEFMVETIPSSLRVSSVRPYLYGQFPIHIACSNESITPKIIQLLLRLWPESSRQQCIFLRFPIHYICTNMNLDNDASLEILALLFESYPEALQEMDDIGGLPVHCAAAYKSLNFCKVLTDMHPGSVRIMDSTGRLAFHYACTSGTLDTVEHLYELFPGGITSQAALGFYPIHYASTRDTGKDKAKVIEFLLKQDPDSVSRVITGTWGSWEGRLPLHLVCNSSHRENLESVKLLFDAHPDTIYEVDQTGSSPVDLAIASQNDVETVAFLKAQLSYALKARSEEAMATPDVNGRFSLHDALAEKACLGAIKLLVRGNPAALQVADRNGALPLHIACESGTVGVFQFLIDLHGGCLNYCDSKKDLPLHYACRGGNCDAVKYLLEKQVSSVSEKNVDNRLPVHLLCEANQEKSPERLETIWRLLVAHPETLAEIPRRPSPARLANSRPWKRQRIMF